VDSQFDRSVNNDLCDIRFVGLIVSSMPDVRALSMFFFFYRGVQTKNCRANRLVSSMEVSLRRWSSLIALFMWTFVTGILALVFQRLISDACIKNN
jgi:hypothetical protein